MRLPIETKRKLLNLSCLVTAIFGVIYLAAAFDGGELVPQFVFDLVMSPLDNLPQLEADEERLMICTIGATIMLLAYLIWAIVRQFYDQNNAAVDRIIITGVIGWYAIEAVFSLIIGYPLNLIFNLLFVFSFVLPAAIRPAEA